MFVLASAVFFLFLVFYISISAAVIYHLREYVLPGWNAGRASIWTFAALAFLLFILAGYFFLQVPWDNLFT